MTRRLPLLLLVVAVSACSDGELDVFVAREAATAGTSATDPCANGGTGAAGSVTATEPLLIDDFEDGNTQCVATDGYWYMVSDLTGWQELTFGEAPDWTSQALHLRGGGFTQWGVALGLDLPGSRSVFDASAYGELRFHARAEPGSTTGMEVHILESDLHFFAKVELTMEWSEYVLPLGSIVSTAGDPACPVDPSAITAIQFFVLSDAPFDYWLDDVVLSP